MHRRTPPRGDHASDPTYISALECQTLKRSASAELRHRVPLSGLSQTTFACSVPVVVEKTGSMSRFRPSLIALTSATLALLSMLFVATAALASGPTRPATATEMSASMEMSADRSCGQEKAAICSTDCAVLCHVLAVPSPSVAKPMGHARVTYQIGSTTLASMSVEAEDPPPR